MGWKENKTAYNLQYKERTYKRVPLDIRFEDYERLKEYAAEHGESINGFIKRAIAETMERDSKQS